MMGVAEEWRRGEISAVMDVWSDLSLATAAVEAMRPETNGAWSSMLPSSLSTDGMTHGDDDDDDVFIINSAAALGRRMPVVKTAPPLALRWRACWQSRRAVLHTNTPSLPTNSVNTSSLLLLLLLLSSTMNEIMRCLQSLSLSLYECVCLNSITQKVCSP